MKNAISLLGTLLLLAACEQVNFLAISAPPPTKEGSIDNEHKTAVLSKNTALAFECYDFEGPCKEVSLSVDDSSIAKIYPAYLDELTWSYYSSYSYEPTTAFIITAQKEGTTTARFSTKGGNADLTITVKK